MFTLILLLLFSLFFCIFYIFSQRSLYRKNIDYKNLEKDSLIKENKLLIDENNILKEQLNSLRENTYNVENNTINQLYIFKGKKALIGDYSYASCYNTKCILLSLGFDVDSCTNIEDIIKTVKSGKKYDIILSNHLYRTGKGEDLLHKLKNIENFNTPIILHSVTSNLESYALNVGFDGFLSKPLKQKDTIDLLKTLVPCNL